MILIVVGILIYFRKMGLDIPTFALVTAIVFIVLLIKITEIHRIRDWWGVTNSELIQSLGLLNKNVREVDFSSISDLFNLISEFD